MFLIVEFRLRKQNRGGMLLTDVHNFKYKTSGRIENTILFVTEVLVSKFSIVLARKMQHSRVSWICYFS